MSFQIQTHSDRAGPKDETVYELGDVAHTIRAEVWPTFGFNCLRWQVKNRHGDWGSVLFTDPNWAVNPVPTRSGHPVLFPFPNRLGKGLLTHEQREFQLPLNDSSGTNAIHGFTPRNPWRVIAQGTAADSAWVTGQFQLSQDAPESVGKWPSDFFIQLTYRLMADRLRVEVMIQNASASGTLPFGLGFHPSFFCPNAPDCPAEEMTLYSRASQIWKTRDALPTGELQPIPEQFDFRSEHCVGATEFDTLVTGLNPDSETLTEVARLGHAREPGHVGIWVPADFRDLVLFTPQHRKAVAIEPYTCATNAAQLHEKGFQAGWRILGPRGVFTTALEYRWNPDH